MLRSLTLTAMPRYQASRAKSACRVGSTCLLWSAEVPFLSSPVGRAMVVTKAGKCACGKTSDAAGNCDGSHGALLALQLDSLAAALPLTACPALPS